MLRELHVHSTREGLLHFVQLICWYVLDVGTVWCNSALFDPVWYTLVRFGAIQHCLTQYGTLVHVRFVTRLVDLVWLGLPVRYDLDCYKSLHLNTVWSS